MITALCGGVGGSKLVLGLYIGLSDDLSVVVNTADDLDYVGLRICPDLDTVCYTLGGLAHADHGWGIEGDTFDALEMLGRYGAPTWFGVGDRDLATHVYRTHALRQGNSLSAVTETIARRLDIRARVLPMSDQRVATKLLAGNEWIEFQEYFVRRRHSDVVQAVRYEGVEKAVAPEPVVEAIEMADVVVIVNSNPVLSILPILAVPAIGMALQATTAKRVAVSPMLGLEAVSGPAGRLMHLLGKPASSLGVAEAYGDWIDGIVIDVRDIDQRPAIEALGIAVKCVNTVMNDLGDKIRLAEETVSFACDL